MKRFIIIILGLLIALLLLYILYKNVFTHPVKKISVEEIKSIQIQDCVYEKDKNSELINQFVLDFNRSRTSSNQYLDTTPDFTVIVNYIDGNKLIIYDGDTTYFYIKYKDKTTIAEGPELVKLLEDLASK